ncbi:MAG: hypothetical protein M3Y91_03355 [Actinomycetota bacterium]|nr:hypothetical protein [Actinomycetota bacterium]
MAAPTRIASPVSVDDGKAVPPPATRERSSAPSAAASEASGAHRAGAWAFTALRLALGFEFLWAFVDKVFGLGYSTPSAKAWINGGSPTKGFLSGVSSGPLQGFSHAISGSAAADWLFMLGLLGIGAALILGVAIRPAVVSGVVLLMLMWLAVWPLATVSGGQATGSTNPVVDEHVIASLGLVVIGVFAMKGAGYLGRRWADLDLIKRMPWLR